MQRFNPEKELKKLQSKKNANVLTSTSSIKNLYLPMLITLCSLVAIIGSSYSLSILDNSEPKAYTIEIDIENGNQKHISDVSSESRWADIVTSNYVFSEIYCKSGNLNYNAETNTIYSNLIKEDTNCKIIFLPKRYKPINTTNLIAIEENGLVSYYYQESSEDNNLVINNIKFKIEKINSDNTVIIKAEEPIIDTYANVNTAIENWINNNLENKSYIIETSYEIINDNQELYNDVEYQIIPKITINKNSFYGQGTQRKPYEIEE